MHDIRCSPLDTEQVHQLGAENPTLEQDPAVYKCFQCLYSSVFPLEEQRIQTG